ncbi:Caspase-7, partial [Stegodyphus mimosarum]
MAGECLIFDYNKFKKGNCRKGSDHDAKRLEQDFSALGFDVTIHPNKTTCETKNILKDASQLERLSNNVFICCILSHGDPGRIQTYDGILYVNDFLKPFKSTSSEGVPKIFIIQACQGKEGEQHVAMIASDSSSEDHCRLTMGVDFLVATSTYPGTWSHRKGTGSYFIQGLCKCLEEHSKERNFLDVLIAVSRLMAYNFQERKTCKKQMPCILSTLTRDISFTKSILPYERRGDNSPDKMEGTGEKSPGKIEGTSEDSPDKIEPVRYNICNENDVKDLPRLNCPIDSPYYPINSEVEFLLFHYQNQTLYFAAAEIYNHFKEFEFRGSDLKMWEFEDGITKYSESKDRNPECFICCVATYYKNQVLYSENQGFLKELIWETFTGNQCSFLAGKPKIFLFVTCEPPDDLKPPPVIASDAAYVCTIPEHADCIEVHLAVKDMEHLTTAVHIFCDGLKEYRQELDLLNILTKINYELFNNEQFKDLNVEDKPLITIFSTLTRS